MFNRSEFDRLQAGFRLSGYSPQMVETPLRLTNEHQTELQPYTEAEMAEMTFEFLVRLNCEVEEIYAHAMGVKL